MMNVCEAGTVRNPAIPSSRALSTETLPSSAPGIQRENSGFRLRSPVMIANSKPGSPSRAGSADSSVPS